MRQPTNYVKFIVIICIVTTLTPPIPVSGLGLVQLSEVPADFSFNTMTLDGSNQTITGGSGQIKIDQLLSINLIEDWIVTVQAPPFTKVGDASTISNSLILNAPVSSDSRITVVGGPWYITPTPTTIIRGRTILGLLTSYSVNFGTNAFSLTIDPGLKYFNYGETTSQYTTTITWTLTTPIL